MSCVYALSVLFCSLISLTQAGCNCRGLKRFDWLIDCLGFIQATGSDCLFCDLIHCARRKHDVADCTRSESASRTKTYETKSIVVAITLSAASGGPRSANSFPGGHSNAHDAYAVAVMHDPGQVHSRPWLHAHVHQSVVSTLLIRCTVCEVVGASLQTSLLSR